AKLAGCFRSISRCARNAVPQRRRIRPIHLCRPVRNSQSEYEGKPDEKDHLGPIEPSGVEIAQAWRLEISVGQDVLANRPRHTQVGSFQAIARRSVPSYKAGDSGRTSASAVKTSPSGT